MGAFCTKMGGYRRHHLAHKAGNLLADLCRKRLLTPLLSHQKQNPDTRCSALLWSLLRKTLCCLACHPIHTHGHSVPRSTSRIAGSQLHLQNRKMNRCSPCPISDRSIVQERPPNHRIMEQKDKAQRGPCLPDSGSLDRGHQFQRGAEAREGFVGMTPDPKGCEGCRDRRGCGASVLWE